MNRLAVPATLLSLRARLVAFGVLCALPVFALLALQRSADAERIREDTVREALASVDQLRRGLTVLLGSVEGVAHVIGTVDLHSRDRTACDASLARATQAMQPHLTIMAVLSPQGEVLCSARPLPSRAHFADRAYFRQALETRAPAVSGFAIGRITGLPALQVAVPQLAPDGSVATVAVVGLLTTTFTDGLMSLPRDGVVFAVYDRDGVLVSREPDSPLAPLGQRFPSAGLSAMLAAGGGQQVTTGPDGVVRLYDAQPVVWRGQGVLMAVVGIEVAPLEAAAAAVRHRQAAIGLMVLLGVVGVAALASRPLVLARLRGLLQAARRAGAGEQVRVPVGVRDEVTLVEEAFNQMLDGVEAKRRSLERSERRYRLLFDKGADGVLHIGPGSVVLAANDAACRLLGRAEPDLRGLEWGALLDPQDARGAALQLVPGSAATLAGEVRLIREDGTPVECEVAATVFEGADLGLACVVLRDLTLRLREQRQLADMNRRLEVRVQQRTAQLEAAVEDLTAFSYSVSHDLRAPVGTIQGFAVVLHERGSLKEPKERHYLERILAASQHANRLIDGLLLLSRITREDLTIATVDLGELAQDALAQCRDTQPERQVHFAVHGDLRVHGDPRLLQILVDNLVGNAWKFTGGVAQARIVLERLPAPAAGSEALFRVGDNGAGFDPAQAGRLFQPFQRLHTAQEFPGSGIGLATVRRVVRRHGGRVWAESPPGGGASIFFTLRTDLGTQARAVADA